MFRGDDVHNEPDRAGCLFRDPALLNKRILFILPV